MIKVRALITEEGIDNFGVSGLTFRVYHLVKGKVYTQADTTNYEECSKNSPPFFVDDNGCSRDITYMVKKRFVEII